MVQINMKMPNNCMVCPLLSYIPHENGDDEPVCYFTGDDLPEGYFHRNDGRPEFCPLIGKEETQTVDLVGKELKDFLTRTINEDVRMPMTALTPDYCRNCPTHPNNGGNGICHCTLGQAVKWE